MKYQVIIALIAGSQAFKLKQHSGVRFTDNESYRNMVDLVGVSETNEIFNQSDSKQSAAIVDSQETNEEKVNPPKNLESDGVFMNHLQGLIGHNEANEVANTPESAYSKEGGVPVLVDPVVRTNTEASTSLGLDMRVGGDDVSVTKKTNEQKLLQDISQTIGTEETKQVLAQQQGVPITVDPVVRQNEVGSAKLGVTQEVGGDMVSYMKKMSLMQRGATDISAKDGKVSGMNSHEGVGGTAVTFTVTFADLKDAPAPTGLKDVKITVGGDGSVDRASGMNGDETVYGNATVTGTPVVFGKKQALVQESPDLKDQKITVGGDRVSGMNGDETIRGPAVVTGTPVIYNQHVQSNGVTKQDDTKLQIDGTSVEM